MNITTKWLYCFRCRSSHLHSIVGDGWGNLLWKCPNCGMEQRKEPDPPSPTAHHTERVPQKENRPNRPA